MELKPSIPIALDAASITVRASCAKTDAGSRAATNVAAARVFHMVRPPTPAATAFYMGGADGRECGPRLPGACTLGGQPLDSLDQYRRRDAARYFLERGGGLMQTHGEVERIGHDRPPLERSVVVVDLLAGEHVVQASHQLRAFLLAAKPDAALVLHHGRARLFALRCAEAHPLQLACQVTEAWCHPDYTLAFACVDAQRDLVRLLVERSGDHHELLWRQQRFHLAEEVRACGVLHVLDVAPDNRQRAVLTDRRQPQVVERAFDMHSRRQSGLVAERIASRAAKYTDRLRHRRDGQRQDFVAIERFVAILVAARDQRTHALRQLGDADSSVVVLIERHDPGDDFVGAYLDARRCLRDREELILCPGGRAGADECQQCEKAASHDELLPFVSYWKGSENFGSVRKAWSVRVFRNPMSAAFSEAVK